MYRVFVAICTLLFAYQLSASEPTLYKVLSDGHELALWEKSAPEPSATVLLLHGGTYSALPDFDLRTAGEILSMMDALVARGFRVLALDARGYGGTQRDQTGWLTPDRAALDVINIIDWITDTYETGVHLYGWSYGSMVSQLVAQRHPDKVASIVLFGYPFDPSRHVVAENFDYPEAPPAKPNTAKHAASDFVVPGAISQAGIDAYVEQALVADPIRVDFKDLHQWAELDAAKVSVPTLLIQGEFDPIAPDEVQYGLFKNLGTAQKWWIVLEGGSHAALLETPRFEMFDAMAVFANKIASQR